MSHSTKKIFAVVSVIFALASCQETPAKGVNCFELQRSVIEGELIAPKTGYCDSVGYLIRNQIGLLYLVENENAAPDQYGIGIADSALNGKSFLPSKKRKVSGKYKVVGDISVSIMDVESIETD